MRRLPSIWLVHTFQSVGAAPTKALVSFAPHSAFTANEDLFVCTISDILAAAFVVLRVAGCFEGGGPVSGAVHWKTRVERAEWAGGGEPMSNVAFLAGVGSSRKMHVTFSPASRS